MFFFKNEAVPVRMLSNHSHAGPAGSCMINCVDSIVALATGG